MTSPITGAVNATTRTVVDYGEDPHNPARGVVADLILRLHGFLVPVVMGGDTEPSTQFHGDYGRELQGFVGAVNPASTAVMYRNGGNAELGDASTGSTMTDPARRMFADRLRRRT